MIADNLAPHFVTELILDFYFEMQQILLVEVYHAVDAL